MEHIYSVIPLLEDHFEERVADAIDQYRRGVTSCPLYEILLQPEGDRVTATAQHENRFSPPQVKL